MSASAKVWVALVAALLLGGCATRAPLEPSGSPSAVTGTSPEPTAAAALESSHADERTRTDAAITSPLLAPAVDPLDTWNRLRDGFEFASCAGDDVARELRAYLRGGRFAAVLASIQPRLRFVLDAVESRNLPTEYALLPIVESHYRAYRARGRRPAGVWQLMPITARAKGLSISSTHDARLDLAASTAAALTLIEGLSARFDGNHAYAVMAYNAGEFRLRRALDRDGRVVEARLPRITRVHLARLNALACLITEPHRHRVSLPSWEPSGALAALRVEVRTSSRLLARLAGLTHAEFVSENVHVDRADGLPAGSFAMVPAARIDSIHARLADVPSAARARWQLVLDGARGWDALASRYDSDAALLKAINGDAAEPPPWVLVPATTPAAPTTAPAISGEDRYQVARGDSLWTIARRFGTSVAALAYLNALGSDAVLQPGQWLRLR